MSFTLRRAVATVGISQTIAYAGSVYLPATLAKPMAQAVGAPESLVFLIFSGALLLQAVMGPRLGRLVDANGGRAPLAAASVAFTLGLGLLALAHNPWQLALGWAVVGLAMGAGLYDIAFAGMVGWFGVEARRGITGITLIAGFASTVGWPLTAWLEHQVGWRGACLFWAAANGLVALPLHLSLPRGRTSPASAPAQTGAEPATSDPQDARRMALTAAAFALLGGVGSAVSAHLPPLLMATGAGATAAVAAAALVGPSQVAARMAEFVLVRRIHPLVSGRIAVSLFPIGAVLLIAAGGAAAAPFAILYGAGNGLFTIVRGTLPLALFGAAGYGRRLGLLNIPSRLTQAAAPFILSLLMARSANLALGVLAACALAALAALLALRRPAD